MVSFRTFSPLIRSECIIMTSVDAVRLNFGSPMNWSVKCVVGRMCVLMIAK